MNIMQINNADCAPQTANDNTGINRITTTFCKYYTEHCNIKCHIGYFRENSYGQSSIFTSRIKLSLPINEEELRHFLIMNEVDVININVSDEIFVKAIPNICRVAHSVNVKVVYCIHFMPGYEAYSYGSFSQVFFNVINGKPLLDSLKKWVMTITRPLSTKLIKRILKSKYRFAYDSCDKVVVFSQQYVKDYMNIIEANQSEKFVVIPNALSFGQFALKENIHNKNKEVIFVGRLHESSKRVSLILKIWKMVESNHQLYDWHLKIVGDGPSKEYYQWLIKKYNLNRVSLEGRRDPNTYYMNSPILIQTSSGEGWPMVLMECMPAGVVPCIFDSYAAARDIIISRSNGILVPNNNVSLFYEELAQLMLNNTTREQMALKAIESSKRFAVESVGTKWVNLFNNLV